MMVFVTVKVIFYCYLIQKYTICKFWKVFRAQVYRSCGNLFERKTSCR